MSQSPQSPEAPGLALESREAEAPEVPLEGGRDDRRPRIPEPPPVTLVSVADPVLLTVAGREAALDAFYVGLLRFRREPNDADGPVYAAENHDLRFRVVETPPERESCRAVGVVTPHFAELIEALQARKMAFEHVRGLHAGLDGVLLQDPAGNWLAITPRREIR